MSVSFINHTRLSLPTISLRRDIKMALTWLRRKGVPSVTPLTLTIIALSPKESQKLNVRFFKKHRPANVLSFAYGREAEVIVAPATIRVQARVARRPYRIEFRRMVVHGLLHLSGYHHERSQRAAEAFERREQQLLEHLRIRRPQEFTGR